MAPVRTYIVLRRRLWQTVHSSQDDGISDQQSGRRVDSPKFLLNLNERAAGDAEKSLDDDQSPAYKQTLKGVKLMGMANDVKIGEKSIPEKALQNVEVS
ncbi:hypothetical protein Pcinc_001283 [Petrolisthes cinctipes]|uniref:Uncharacterized protein n=1 Tax=Petrolisthes cinctipes TaxID=88211 RepID=A0AAE1GLM2_PETCI|nr:hypothetical protein Pcinc_001283 [Petrolisthes cinctipes]